MMIIEDEQELVMIIDEGGGAAAAVIKLKGKHIPVLLWDTLQAVVTGTIRASFGPWSAAPMQTPAGVRHLDR